MASSKVDIFTAAMRAEFVRAMNEPVAPAPWEKFTSVLNSSARIENYAWFTPTPGVAEYKGHRRYGKIGTIDPYKVENKEYDASFQVLLRDIEDDLVGGYKMKPAELAERVRQFRGRLVLKTLADGKNQNGFDATKMFADSHTIGTGDNLLTFNAASNDGVNHNLIALVHSRVLKPMVYQDRKAVKFNDDAGSKESEKIKLVSYWADLEGASAYGYWWDAVYVDITDTPNVDEIQTIFGNITTQLRGFKMPKALDGDETEYPHEGTEFSSANLTIVVNPGLEHVSRQALTQDWIPQDVGETVATTNQWKGFANLVVTNYMNE